MNDELDYTVGSADPEAQEPSLASLDAASLELRVAASMLAPETSSSIGEPPSDPLPLTMRRGSTSRRRSDGLFTRSGASIDWPSVEFRPLSGRPDGTSRRDGRMQEIQSVYERVLREQTERALASAARQSRMVITQDSLDALRYTLSTSRGGTSSASTSSTDRS